MAREFAKSFYNSRAWKELRERVFTEAHGLCEQCGEPGLEVDHIVELSPGNINDRSVTLNRDNLRLLCFRCHKIKHQKKEKDRAGRECLFDANGNIIGVIDHQDTPI